MGRFSSFAIALLLCAAPLHANEGGHGEGHGEAPPAEEHGGGHGGEKKEEKKVYPAYSETGADKCKIPKAHKKRFTAGCGTEDYAAYAKAVDEYNACVEGFDSKIFLPLRPCVPKPKKKTGPDYRKLLDPP